MVKITDDCVCTFSDKYGSHQDLVQYSKIIIQGVRKKPYPLIHLLLTELIYVITKYSLLTR